MNIQRGQRDESAQLDDNEQHVGVPSGLDVRRERREKRTLRGSSGQKSSRLMPRGVSGLLLPQVFSR
ncbi:hypothetical protein E2C01_066417 [Portunus trituberculatus]|uniref:Uncharacterized protein n=1 Tax=Portunus trituberculatus TaxID=210409 RepID=A0A5B7HPP8_PORTR|nr:hypothetical protein [Portunus trituberculatus]